MFLINETNANTFTAFMFKNKSSVLKSGHQVPKVSKILAIERHLFPL